MRKSFGFVLVREHKTELAGRRGRCMVEENSRFLGTCEWWEFLGRLRLTKCRSKATHAPRGRSHDHCQRWQRSLKDKRCMAEVHG
jgi:hypothetical protein